jgi:spore coat protein U-like protein
MKRFISLVAAASVITASGAAFAASKSATVAVDATVLAACSVTNGTLAFGSIDPTTAPAVGPTPSTGLTVTCTNGSAYTITYASTNASKLSNGTDSFNYTYTPVTNGGTGTGTAQDIVINGSIAAGAYSTMPAGTYTDTITATFNY